MGATVGGVGVLLSNFAKKVLVSVCYISPRILKVTLNGNPQTTIIVTYSPTNVADEDDVTDFYNQLTKATSEVPEHNFLVVIGDFNARMNFHASIENNIVVTNTTFKKRATKLWTCELPNYCMRSAIDGREENLGFTVNPRRSRRVGPLCVTDLDFADDIALISDTASQAQELLEMIEKAALRVGLHMNTKKTKCMVFNQQTEVDIMRDP
ncbi:craniofacial development protein 2-like [Amphiura filiformis]|uniref:craniofacial development protein 2-like n=1 Tax=Amphiura filiformis TaxID=82378 RepID=UPI003B21839B